MKKSLGLALAASLALSFGGAANVAHADTVGPTTFESPTYTTVSIDGQNGWSSTGGFDQAVAATTRFAGFGAQSLRISNAVTSDGFPNQTISPPLANPAGESTPQRHYDATFQIGTMLDTVQPGLALTVSPSDGNSSRMSFLRFEDQNDGVHVFFDDVTDAGPLGTVAEFNETDIATLARTSAHAIRFSIDFYTGPANDVVKIYLDGALKTTGTTWEDYYRYDPEATVGTGNKVPPVSKLMFRVNHEAAPSTVGKGFLVDNLTLASSPSATRLSDFNNDEFTDLVARDAAGKLWLYPGNGAGGFLPRHQMGTGWNGMTAMVTPGDVTGDGNADVLARDSLGRMWLYSGNGAGGVNPGRQIGSGWQSYTVTNAANLNGTGGPDLLARDSAGNLWLYPLSGNAVFGTRSLIGTGWNGYTLGGPGDVSGDGKADLLARDTTGKLWLYPANGTGGVTARTLVGTGWQAMTAMVTPGNWDKTGGNDVLARDTTGKLWLYPRSDAGTFGQQRQAGSGWQFMTFIG